ncbi:MAG TPA: hypothetical protein VEQ85_04535 [Lacipirellulaceae bacterium]|nr:hypothetical protein [Lacipirellulaceae bacterium]
MDAAYRHRVERARKLTPAQRFLETLEMVEVSRELMKAGIRMQFPEADEALVREKMRQRLATVRGVENPR